MTELTGSEGVHQLYYLGVVDINSIEQGLESEECAQTVRSVEERIIDQIESAQLAGILPRLRKPDARPVTVHVSKTGVKFIDAADQHVLERLALHKVVLVNAYDDDQGNYNVVLLVKKSTYDQGLEQCHVLQTTVADEADHLCKQIRQAFEAVEADVVSKRSAQ